MNRFASFDQATIAYHDEGAGPAVILLHGFGLDGLKNFGHFDESRPVLERTMALFRAEMGFAPPLPDPPVEGRVGLIARLLAVGARVIVPDMRGFGASDKPHDTAAYANSAMARDVVALIDHLSLDTVDVLGFSMGSVTAAKLLALKIKPVKSAILVGIGDYVLAGVPLTWPKHWPRPGNLPESFTMREHALAGADVLARGEIIPGDLMSANVILVRATGADSKALAAVMRGAVAEPVAAEDLCGVDMPVLILNGKADVANQSVGKLMAVLPNVRSAACEGDHSSTPYQPSFHEVVCRFFQDQWRSREESFEPSVQAGH